MRTPFQTYLRSIGACKEAVIWADKRTAKQAWDECTREDWLLWWAAKNVGCKTLIKAACQCVRRISKAVEITEMWADGKASISDVKETTYAAYAAYIAAHASATDATTYAIADIAYADYAVAYMGYTDACSAPDRSIAYAVAHAINAIICSTTDDTHKTCADIVREIIPFWE